MRGLRRSTQRARNKGKIAQGAAIQMNHFLLNVEMSEWRSSTEQGIRTMQPRFAARSPARPSHQHQRCSCPHSPRGRLRYADRLRRPAGATANLKLHSTWTTQRGLITPSKTRTATRMEKNVGVRGK